MRAMVKKEIYDYKNLYILKCLSLFRSYFPTTINRLVPELFFFLILAHTVFKCE